MNIAFYHATLPNPRRAKEGGVTYAVHQLANTLVRRGHALTVYSFDPRPEDALYNVRQLPLRRWAESTLGRLSITPLLLSGLDLCAFDVMHAHGDDHFVLQRPIPWVRTMYGSAKREYASAVRLRRRVSQLALIPLEGLSSRRADIAVGISHDTRLCIPTIDDIVPCGVDLTLYRLSPRSRSTAPSILFVGTTGGRKRGDLLLREFIQRIRPTLPNAELWMVCEPQAAIDGVRWCGKVSEEELVRLYQQAWVFCLPSTYEGFGIPYIEALACGTPVVATPNPGAREILNDGRYGMLTGDDELPATLLRLLQDAEQRRKLADAGYARAQEYGWDAVAIRYEHVYRRAQSAGTGNHARAQPGVL